MMSRSRNYHPDNYREYFFDPHGDILMRDLGFTVFYLEQTTE
jgi:hypothetical protein